MLDDELDELDEELEDELDDELEELEELEDEPHSHSMIRRMRQNGSESSSAGVSNRASRTEPRSSDAVGSKPCDTLNVARVDAISQRTTVFSPPSIGRKIEPHCDSVWARDKTTSSQTTPPQDCRVPMVRKNLSRAGSSGRYGQYPAPGTPGPRSTVFTAAAIRSAAAGVKTTAGFLDVGRRVAIS